MMLNMRLFNSSTLATTLAKRVVFFRNTQTAVYSTMLCEHPLSKLKLSYPSTLQCTQFHPRALSTIVNNEGEISSIKQKINAVEKEIINVNEEISTLANEIKMLEKGPQNKHLRRKEEHLLMEKQQLRRKEEQLTELLLRASPPSSAGNYFYFTFIIFFGHF